MSVALSADVAHLSDTELLQLFNDTVTRLEEDADAHESTTRTLLLLSTLLLERGHTAASLTALLRHSSPALVAALATLTAAHAAQWVPLLLARAWTGAALFIAALEHVLQRHASHVQFAALVQDSIRARLRQSPLPWEVLLNIAPHRHVTLALLIGLLRQYATEPAPHVFEAEASLRALREVFCAEISAEHVTLSALCATLVRDFTTLTCDARFSALWDTCLPWLYRLIIEIPPSVTCLITCLTREHWPLYCALGARDCRARPRDHPAVELFRRSVHHVLMTRVDSDVTALVGDHVLSEMQYGATDTQHLISMLALVNDLHGTVALRHLAEYLTRHVPPECQQALPRVRALIDRLAGHVTDHVRATSIDCLTRVSHNGLAQTFLPEISASRSDSEIKAIFSILAADMCHHTGTVHEQAAALLVTGITKYVSLRGWLEEEISAHVTPSHLPRPSAEQYRELLPKKSPLEYDLHLVHVLNHQPRVLHVLAATATPATSPAVKELLTSTLAVLTGLWHALAHHPHAPAQRVQHVTGDLIRCLQRTGALPALPLAPLAHSGVSRSEMTSLLHALWTYLLDCDTAKLAAKCNMLTMNNPQLGPLLLLEGTE